MKMNLQLDTKLRNFTFKVYVYCYFNLVSIPKQAFILYENNLLYSLE